MAARLPPLSHARDAEFWRQRIQKEQRVAEYKEVFAAAGLVSPRFLAPMSPRAAFNDLRLAMQFIASFMHMLAVNCCCRWGVTSIGCIRVVATPQLAEKHAT